MGAYHKKTRDTKNQQQKRSERKGGDHSFPATKATCITGGGERPEPTQKRKSAEKKNNLKIPAIDWKEKKDVGKDDQTPKFNGGDSGIKGKEGVEEEEEKGVFWSKKARCD